MIEKQLQNELRSLLGDRVAFDEPLARHTSLRVGGPADAFARPESRQQATSLLRLCAKLGVPWVVLGAGFNTLVRTAGVRGVVVQLDALRAVEPAGDAVLRVEAGATHTSITRLCAEHGLAGLEFAVGIPGTAGGWLAMNAGIPGREIKDVAVAIEWLDTNGESHVTRSDALRFRYRALEHPAGALLLAARFGLHADTPEAIRERMRELLSTRRATQPVDRLSCGSVFVNPPGDFAGRLIEAAGLKGAREGGAQISELHANFIVNSDGASADDVLRLIDRAREAVRARFGIELEPEVRLLGETS